MKNNQKNHIYWIWKGSISHAWKFTAVETKNRTLKMSN